MARHRLEELRQQYDLTAAAVERLDRLLSVLASADHAPTSVTDPRTAVDVHVADSLSGLDVPALRAASRIADLGSGAGFPALVLASVLDDGHVTAVESAGRKCDFIREAAAAVGLGNVSVVCSRAEDWRAGVAANDVVCARALAALGVLCEYAAPLLAEGGTLVAWKGHVHDLELGVARRAAAELGLSEPVLTPAHPYPGSERRHLAVAVKERATPERFPRRTGVALKRPLGATRPVAS